MRISEEQQYAIDICTDITTKIACVTGQAGTGKTTILKNVYEELKQNLNGSLTDVDDFENTSIRLAAPTGRAAKRIEEATGIPAMTIHRMLRYTTPEDDDDITLPRHDKFNPLPHDVVLIDEASMIDETLWRGVIDALKKGAIIRFFGDINQLPPVASDTSPFAKALEKFPTGLLTENYRSDDGIISVSDKVINGKIPITNEQVQVFKIKSTETMNHIREICDNTDFTKLSAQIICPTQRTRYGCTPINNFIQQKYNPEVDKLKVYIHHKDAEVECRSFKVNDKILWTKNDYNVEIMNGTLGIVKEFNSETGEMVLTLDGNRDVIIPPTIEGFNQTTGQRFRYDPRAQIQLGYAITTHKSQGSQFNTVLYVLSRSRAATRQNLYTAITRAKKQLVMLNVSGALIHTLNTKAQL